MSFKDFFDESKSLSSMRLNTTIVVITVCFCLFYLTFTAGAEIAGYLIGALGIAITGKAVQKFKEGKKNVQDGSSNSK